MLKDDIEKYTNLTGEDGWHVPIMKVGAYLDGYNKGLDVLGKIRAEIIELPTISFNANDVYKADVLQIINKYKEESEG